MRMSRDPSMQVQLFEPSKEELREENAFEKTQRAAF